MRSVDLFAGPGGFGSGHRMARPDDASVGVENDPVACRTAEAAGLPRVMHSVTSTDAIRVVQERLGGDPEHHHGSPPCQGFSLIGNGLGRLDADRLMDNIRIAGEHPFDADHVETMMEGFQLLAHDHRSALTLEPLRWAAHLPPTFITMEQVATVQPIWDAYADTLRAWGYSVWTGHLHAEQYGVPQSRKRSILMARLGAEKVLPPQPTHSRYHSRDPWRMDDGVKPWVSVAEALGWVLPEEDPMGGSGWGSSRPTQWNNRREESEFWAPRVNNQTGQDFDFAGMASTPATTLGGRCLVPFRGDFNLRSRNDGFVVNVQQAGILQSFPADYPWQGSESEQFRQVGDAVPPLLAAAIVEALIP